LQALISVLPLKITQAVGSVDHSDNLIEIVMDLGRTPVARFTDG
jgi:stage III sporulation protein SpoIIIAA